MEKKSPQPNLSSTEKATIHRPISRPYSIDDMPSEAAIEYWVNQTLFFSEDPPNFNDQHSHSFPDPLKMRSQKSPRKQRTPSSSGSGSRRSARTLDNDIPLRPAAIADDEPDEAGDPAADLAPSVAPSTGEASSSHSTEVEFRHSWAASHLSKGSSASTLNRDNVFSDIPTLPPPARSSQPASSPSRQSGSASPKRSRSPVRTAVRLRSAKMQITSIEKVAQSVASQQLVVELEKIATGVGVVPEAVKVCQKLTNFYSACSASQS